MRRIVVILVAAVIAGLILLTRSASAPIEEVQPIAWNQEACGHCRMLVGDPRYAAQVVTASGDVRSFDDPGCALRYMAEHDGEIRRAWFHHGERNEWLPAERVGFARRGQTPMGFGLVAVDRETPGAIDLATAMRLAGGAR